MAENRCICCGEIIPEGMMVCPKCQVSVKPKTNADHIRNYDDGELRDFICGLTTCEICRFATTNGCALKVWLEGEYIGE